MPALTAVPALAAVPALGGVVASPVLGADSTGPLDLINGIPVHPLVVHAAVVLVPLAALGVLLMAFIPRFSRRLGWLVVLGALAATGATVVAKLAGEKLAARIGEPGFDHESLGSVMPYFAGALSVVAIVLWILDRRRVEEAPAPRGALGVVVAVLAAAVALGNVAWVYRVGDSGARSVWAGVVATSEQPSPSPSPTATEPTTPSPTSGSTSSPAATAAAYTMTQVSAHNLQGDCWAAVDGSVYDLTAWIAAHPGGPQHIIPLCGTDATAAFTTQHDGRAEPHEQLARFKIGTLES